MGRSSVLGDYFSQGYQSVPHIIPGVLYPAIKDSGGTVRLLDRTTAHSGDYGTAQSDGRKYYYTDIKGSKPIRDPRIGAHFGSQRYKTTTMQLLEQETVTEGKNIYSIDGREWLRAYSGNSEWINYNDLNGTYLQAPPDCTGNFIEITGYFNDINFAITTHSNRCDDIDISVNGTLSVDGSATLGGRSTVASPLGSRFVGMGSFINGGSTLSASLGTTPQINTVRYEMKTGSGEYVELHAIELIVQDTGTTARRSQINIPAQNVVSYGKRFSIGSDTLTDSVHTHYDPFNGFTDDTTLFSAKVDTATSLGLGTATTWGAAWDTGSDNHIRPFNGGRVVKWIDSDGTIKTSVTMMPRNAQNIGTTASNEITDVSSTNSHTINFSDDAVEHSLSEVAKTFHWREFGNGAANGGTGATYADASMLNTADDIAYVMDDGLTSLSADDVSTLVTPANALNLGNTDTVYITFIGTGISVFSPNWAENANAWHHIAQNLPYGTHILKIHRDGSSNSTIDLDGVSILGSTGTAPWKNPSEITFHQPKRPPIPEHACVIADYMLMADFVAFTPTANDPSKISKGVRYIHGSRDLFYDITGGSRHATTFTPRLSEGIGRSMSTLLWDSITANSPITLPYFGFTKGEIASCWNSDSTAITVKSTNSSGTLETTNVTIAGTPTITSQPTIDATQTNQVCHFVHFNKSDGVLGSNTMSAQLDYSNSTDDWSYFNSFCVATPIHTSHHYTPFETPCLHELIGGDRNMEQTHLICSPDGKTWDEITRDTSYIGKAKLQATRDGGDLASSEENFITDLVRGNVNTHIPLIQKDFALAYDRYICLKSGLYRICFNGHGDYGGASAYAYIYVNGAIQLLRESDPAASRGNPVVELSLSLKRGDHIEFKGIDLEGSSSNYFSYVLINEL